MGATQSSSPARGTLIAHPARGRAEPIRLCHAAALLPLEEIAWDDQMQMAGTAHLPFGQAPLYVTHGAVFAQMDAILRLVGRHAGMYGISALHDVRIDEVLCGAHAIRERYEALVYGPFSKESLMDYHKLHIGDAGKINPRNGGAHLGYLNSYVGRSSTEWTASTQAPSIADVQVFDIFDLHLRLFGEEVRSRFPDLTELCTRFAELEGVREFLASPERRNRPINHNTSNGTGVYPLG